MRDGRAAGARRRASSSPLWIEDARPGRRCAATRGRLRQVLTNLLANAIKFTRTARCRCACAAERRGRRARAAARRGARHRHRDRAGRARAAVRAVHAGRHVDDPALRRHRPRPRDLAPARRDDGRRADRRVASPGAAARSASRRPLARRRAPRAEPPRARSLPRRCACSSSTTTRPTARSSRPTSRARVAVVRRGRRAGRRRSAHAGAPRPRRPALRARGARRPDARDDGARWRARSAPTPAPARSPGRDADLGGRRGPDAGGGDVDRCLTKPVRRAALLEARRRGARGRAAPRRRAAPAATRRRAAPPARGRVLVAEDNPVNRS